MTNLDSILKSRDITVPTKVHLVKAIVLPVVMHGYESGTIKRLSAEELLLLNCGVQEVISLQLIKINEKKKKKRLLRVPWTVRKSHQSILKEINLEYSLEGHMLKIKQYFGYLM